MTRRLPSASQSEPPSAVHLTLEARSLFAVSANTRLSRRQLGPRAIRLGKELRALADEPLSMGQAEEKQIHLGYLPYRSSTRVCRYTAGSKLCDSDDTAAAVLIDTSLEKDP
jgi:hypothetical protein